jgi:hypothetical protein
MKHKIKALIPKAILVRYWEYKRWIGNKRNATQSTMDVFSDIYKKNIWGGELGSFCSGTGSLMDEITKPYILKITEILKSYGTNMPTIVDLGCGDFRIGQNFINYCSKYTAVDIVPALIDKHKATGYGKNVDFLCLDITEDSLPEGDICFLRQVLQHLSNDQISKILPKLSRYKLIFVTEHYPSNNPNIEPNKDKICGAEIRLYKNSGVYLDAPPFNIPSSALEILLEIPVSGINEELDDLGVIRTYKLQL